MVSTVLFTDALRVIDAGDTLALERMIQDEPNLVRARWEGVEPPYDAYFQGATLLHHTAGNPLRGELSPKTVDVARVLLDYGADVDASTQNGDWSWTTLGLAATGSKLVHLNLDLALLDLLLEYGSDPDCRDGIALYGALFHVMEEPRLLRSARYLALRGASLDLAFAAGVGSIDTVCRYLEPKRLSRDAYRMYRMTSDRVEQPDDQYVLDEALTFASLCGQTECARLLIQRGAHPSSWTSLGRLKATPLHWAAYAGWADTVALLLSKGAKTSIEDPVYNATPLGWAQHAGKDATTALLT